MKRTNNQLAVPEMKEASWAEAFLQSIHNAVSIGSVPIVSPTICAILSSRIKSLGEKRFHEFMIDVINHIALLDKNILKSDDFAIATELTLRKVVNEHDKNKRKRFSKLYTDFIKHQHDDSCRLDIDTLEICLSIVHSLSENSLFHLIMLRDAGLIAPFKDITECSEKFKKFREVVKQRSEVSFYHRSMAELEQTGVTTQASGLWGGNIPYVTQLGLNFIQWLGDETN